MGITLNGSTIAANQGQELLRLTDGAKLDVTRVDFDEQNQVLCLSLRRKATRGPMASPTRQRDRRRLTTGTMVGSRMTVREVQRCSVISRCGQRVSEVTILFGMKVDGHSIYLSSAEELGGDLMYEMRIDVGAIDIEIEDL